MIRAQISSAGLHPHDLVASKAPPPKTITLEVRTQDPQPIVKVLCGEKKQDGVRKDRGVAFAMGVRGDHMERVTLQLEEFKGAVGMSHVDTRGRATWWWEEPGQRLRGDGARRS